jgi:hypothetical protein
VIGIIVGKWEGGFCTVLCCSLGGLRHYYSVSRMLWGWTETDLRQLLGRETQFQRVYVYGVWELNGLGLHINATHF